MKKVSTKENSVVVNPGEINRELFTSNRKDAREEQLRLWILGAFDWTDSSPLYQKTYRIFFQPPVKVKESSLEKLSSRNPNGKHWLGKNRLCLYWAQEIQKQGESAWNNLCIQADKKPYYWWVDWEEEFFGAMDDCDRGKLIGGATLEKYPKIAPQIEITSQDNLFFFPEYLVVPVWCLESLYSLRLE